MQYLVNKGIDSQRINAAGFGQLRPIDTNDTPEGRANNRRVEMKLNYDFNFHVVPSEINKSKILVLNRV